MTENKTTYYSLNLKGNTGYFPSGDEFRGSTEPLLIGETADCDIRFKQSDDSFAPEYYAAILPNEDKESWRIVRLSPYVDVSISGVGSVKSVCALKPGDRISFSGTPATLKFSVHHDSNFHTDGRIVVTRRDYRLSIIFFVLLAVVLFLIGLKLNMREHDITEGDLEAFKPSVYVIQVDSVDCVRMVGDSIDGIAWTDNFPDGHNEMGTAFLTADSTLITARHCIEFWMGCDPDLQLSIADYSPNDIVRRVAEAETYNFTHEESDTLYQLRAYCTAWNENDSIGFKFVSTDPNVFIDRSRDMMIVIDDYNNRYYWRSMTPHFSRRDMELGDVAAIKVDKAGNIRLADPSVLNDLSEINSTGILGYPETGFETRRLDFSPGTIQHEMTSHGGGIIVTKGEAAHGHSGSPLFIYHDGDFKVLGVLSKVDPINGEIKYSVPLHSMNFKFKGR